MTIFLSGLKTTTPGNSRRHWRAEWREGKTAREKTKLALLSRKPLPAFPVTVTLTRHSVGTCDRHNLPGAMKHVIDGISDAYGIDDGNDGWEFVFRQVKCKKGMGGVEIEIASRATVD